MEGSRISLYLSLIYTFFMAIGANEWGYTGEYGPSHWSDESPQCAGTSQSPINIVTNEVLIDPLLQMLEFTGYGQTLEGGTFINNGHTVQLNLSTNKTFKISGGAMGDNTYTALQLHFHWSAPGSTDGSEHTVDGKHYPAEMHIVHIKDPYTAIDQVKDTPDGLAVLGVFLDVGEKENLAFGELFMTAKDDCKYEGTETTLHLGPRLFSLLPDSGSFYRYSGSLTTPSCYETVTWTVLQNPVMISERQLGILQSLKSVSRPEAANETLDVMVCEGKNCTTRHRRAVNATNNADNSLGGNYRPTEPLNGRIVTSYLDIGYVKIDHSHDWTYSDHLSGTTQWSKNYPTCGKKSQSPINVDSSNVAAPDVVNSSGLAEAMVFNGYDTTLKGTFVNNGHAVQLNFDSDLQYVITKGGLKSSYTAVQLHFHWGEALSDRKISGGSEHTVDNKQYDAEMHIVHGKTSEMEDLNSYRETAADAYAVLGVFVKVFENESEASSDDGANAHMQQLFEAITKVRFSGDASEFSSGPSLQSLLPDDKSFYRYDGSLTTPPCSESVIWTVFSEPIIISLNQFIAFQRLFNVEATQVSNRSSIKVKREMALLDVLSNNGKSKTEAEIPDAASSPENPGKEALDSLKSTSGKSTPYTLVTNTTASRLLRNNYRPVQQLNNRTVHYYDLSGTTVTTGEPTESTGLPVWEIVVFTGAGIVVFVIFLIIVTRCTCKKGKKTKYSAGQREGNEAITL